MKSIHFATEGNRVAAKLREFEGVGRAEWTTLDTMSVEVAENLLTQFKEALDVARVNDMGVKAERLKNIKSDIEKQRREILDLEKEACSLDKIVNDPRGPKGDLGEMHPESKNPGQSPYLP